MAGMRQSPWFCPFRDESSDRSDSTHFPTGLKSLRDRREFSFSPAHDRDVRILYGVFGYGRGHATRALGVLPHLLARHEVLVLAGGDAYETLRLAGLPVVAIPTLAYVYRRDGRRCVWRSLLGNARGIADLAL